MAGGVQWSAERGTDCSHKEERRPHHPIHICSSLILARLSCCRRIWIISREEHASLLRLLQAMPFLILLKSGFVCWSSLLVLVDLLLWCLVKVVLEYSIGEHLLHMLCHFVPYIRCNRVVSCVVMFASSFVFTEENKYVVVFSIYWHICDMEINKTTSFVFTWGFLFSVDAYFMFRIYLNWQVCWYDNKKHSFFHLYGSLFLFFEKELYVGITSWIHIKPPLT